MSESLTTIEARRRELEIKRWKSANMIRALLSTILVDINRIYD